MLYTESLLSAAALPVHDLSLQTVLHHPCKTDYQYFSRQSYIHKLFH